MYENIQAPEKAILIGIETGIGDGKSLLDELGELVKTAGAEVAQKFLQKRVTPDPALYIGKGKLEEIKQIAEDEEVNLLVFDDELSGAQIRNIEEVTGLKAVDRTTIILDIFASRAMSKEGRLQVELAQQKYRLPRLMGVGTELSRLGGGIGTRGPGETKLETDRRHIRRRVSFLERELKELGKRRNFQRQARRKNDVPIIALAGYTNTGKSTLLNTLCHSEVIAENMLFATLDPTARKLILPSGREVVLIDTVGFIRKLPHDLVDAFKSTLEEVVSADLLLHVADINNPETEEQIKVVNGILQELGANQENMLLVLNKIDMIPPLTSGFSSQKTYKISALSGQGIKELLHGIETNLPIGRKRLELLVPYSEGWVLPYIYENGELLNSECVHEGINAVAMVDISAISKLEEFIITDY
jgi:GTP-binding protein HflX